MLIMSLFSENLRALRAEKRAHQKDLADFLDITVRQYQRYEGGEQEPHIEGLVAIADYFGVSIDYLVGRTGNPEINR